MSSYSLYFFLTYSLISIVENQSYAITNFSLVKGFINSLEPRIRKVELGVFTQIHYSYSPSPSGDYLYLVKSVEIALFGYRNYYEKSEDLNRRKAPKWSSPRSNKTTEKFIEGIKVPLKRVFLSSIISEAKIHPEFHSGSLFLSQVNDDDFDFPYTSLLDQTTIYPSPISSSQEYSFNILIPGFFLENINENTDSKEFWISIPTGEPKYTHQDSPLFSFTLELSKTPSDSRLSLKPPLLFEHTETINSSDLGTDSDIFKNLKNSIASSIKESDKKYEIRKKLDKELEERPMITSFIIESKNVKEEISKLKGDKEKMDELEEFLNKVTSSENDDYENFMEIKDTDYWLQFRKVLNDKDKKPGESENEDDAGGSNVGEETTVRGEDENMEKENDSKKRFSILWVTLAVAGTCLVGYFLFWVFKKWRAKNLKKKRIELTKKTALIWDN